MRLVALLAILAATQGLAVADDRRCSGLPEGSTAAEACNRMASVDKGEKKIEALVRQLQQGYTKGGHAENAKLLERTQRSWLEYRASTCELEQNLSGGALQISYWRCMDRLTRQRLEDLNELK